MVNIRPEELHAEYRVLQAKDVTDLFVGKELFERVSPLSGKKTGKFYLDVLHSKYLKCEETSLVYLSPLPSTDRLVEYFSRSKSANFFHEVLLSASAEARRETLFAERAELTIKEVGSANCSILDVGSSIGTFLEVIRDRGAKVFGVEVNERALEIAKSKKISMAASVSDALQLCENSCDVITAWEVFAHLIDPVSELQKMAKLLKPRGKIIFTTPNFDSFEYQLLLHRHPNVQFAFLQLFSKNNIEYLINKAGFDLISLKTPGKMDISNISEGLARQNREGWPDIIESVLYSNSQEYQMLRAELQKVLTNALFSGHMLGVARKR